MDALARLKIAKGTKLRILDQFQIETVGVVEKFELSSGRILLLVDGRYRRTFYSQDLATVDVVSTFERPVSCTDNDSKLSKRTSFDCEAANSEELAVSSTASAPNSDAAFSHTPVAAATAAEAAPSAAAAPTTTAAHHFRPSSPEITSVALPAKENAEHTSTQQRTAMSDSSSPWSQPAKPCLPQPVDCEAVRNKLPDRKRLPADYKSLAGGLQVCRDSDGFLYFLLPAARTTPDLPSFAGRRERIVAAAEIIVEKAHRTRSRLWEDLDHPPILFTPSRLYMVEQPNDLFEEAVDRLLKEPSLGVSLECVERGRHGTLSYIVLSTPDRIFMFDIKALGGSAFKFGLKYILQSEKIRKVLHDVRFASDMLEHEYGVKLVNVFDTMLADAFFTSSTTTTHHRYARSYEALCREYLGVREEDLFFPLTRKSTSKEDRMIWLERPLTHQLKIGAAQNCMYLLNLAKICEKALLYHYQAGLSILLSAVRDANDLDAAEMARNPTLLPRDLNARLPSWPLDKDKSEPENVGLYVPASLLKSWELPLRKS